MAQERPGEHGAVENPSSGRRDPFPACARVVALAEKAAAAAQALSSSTVLLEEIGASPPSLAKLNERTLAAIRTQLDEATFAKAWEQGQALTADQAVALALDALD